MRLVRELLFAILVGLFAAWALYAAIFLLAPGSILTTLWLAPGLPVVGLISALVPRSMVAGVGAGELLGATVLVALAFWTAVFGVPFFLYRVRLTRP
jgi:Predicted membrane-associated, metal-dependent hydrolase